MPTNADLQQLINELSKRVAALEGRMNTYEQKLENTHIVLLQVQKTVNGYREAIAHFIQWLKRVVIWAFSLATVIVGGLIVAYITAHYIH